MNESSYITLPRKLKNKPMFCLEVLELREHQVSPCQKVRLQPI